MAEFSKYENKRIFEELLGVTLLDEPQQLIKCPFHKDTNPSFSINIEKGVYNCFNPDCGAHGNIYTLAKHFGKRIDDFGNLIDENSNDTKPKSKPKTNSPYTLSDYVKEKKLDEKFLQKTFKLSSDNNVIMPYYDVNNKFLYNKYRSHNKRMWSDKGIKPQPYGLWLLPKANKKTIWIVEGESDTQTLWQNGIPAIGFPGASTPHHTFFENIQDFNTIVIVCESDEAGEKFITNIYEIMRDYYHEKLIDTYIVFPKDIGKKDINEIWQIKPERDFFKKKLDILYAIKTNIMVVYDQISQKSKWYEPSIRTMAIGLLPKLNVVYKDDMLYKWDTDKKEYKRIKNPEHYYKTFLTKRGINMPNKMNQLKTQLDTFVQMKQELIVPDVKYVHLKNTSVNYEDLTTKHFDERYFIINRIPFDYNPNAKSFIIDKLFNDWVDNPKLLYEIIGYSLIKHYPKNKWFILYGKGGNGKTTFLNLLDKLLCGIHKQVNNVAHVGLNELLNDRFAPARLFNKLLNSAGEIGYDKLINTKALKDLTGEDPIEGQFKFTDSFEFTNYAKLMFATNKIPATTDTTDGFFRRVVIVKFKQIEREKRDPTLLRKIKEEDYEYMLYKSIQALKELYDRDFEFSVEEDVEKTYMDLSNPIRMYIEQQCEITHNSNDYIITSDFIDSLNTWLKKTSQPVYRTKEIYIEMQEMGFEKTRIRVFGGNQRTVFLGLRYKNDIQKPTENELDEIPF